MSIQALIFDFDGTILDTETPEFESWRDVYADHGCELPRLLWENTIGRGKDQITFDPHTYLLERSEKPVDADRIRVWRRERFAQRLAAEPLRAGVLAILLEAKAMGLKLGIASSSDRAWVEGHLKRFEILSFFDATCCADDVSRTKPDPELYRTALARLGAAAAEAIAVEDSPNGLLAAKRAEIFCVAVPNPMTRNLIFDTPDLVLDSLEERSLAALLEAAESRTVFGGSV
ncbi:MAG: HAD-IA family hydrolase [Cytophagales bacterium]|nr:HAD-IA family hydrolase [Armatimonadota bacterium]